MTRPAVPLGVVLDELAQIAGRLAVDLAAERALVRMLEAEKDRAEEEADVPG